MVGWINWTSRWQMGIFNCLKNKWSVLHIQAFGCGWCSFRQPSNNICFSCFNICGMSGMLGWIVLIIIIVKQFNNERVLVFACCNAKFPFLSSSKVSPLAFIPPHKHVTHNQYLIILIIDSLVAFTTLYQFSHFCTILKIWN